MPDQARRFARLAVGVAAASVMVAGCKVDTLVGLTLEEAGNGAVSIRVGLDDEALRNLGVPFDASLISNDLLDQGWSVEGPVTADGLEVIRVTRPFSTIDEANEVLGDITPPGSPFRDFTLDKSSGLFTTTYSFSGQVDFADSLERFADEQLLANLRPGDDAGPIRQRIAELQDESFPVTVAVRLPGDVQSNAVRQADNGATWTPRVSEGGVTELRAAGEVVPATTRRALVGVAAAAAIGLGIWALRRRRTPAG